MKQASRRRLLSNLVVAMCGLAVLLALIPLALIFIYVLKQGFSSLNWDFFTKMPKPVGEAGGGMANAMLGTLFLIALASVVAIPVGIIAGVYLSEYKGARFASLVRFTADVLNGVPSSLREGALALGATRARATFGVMVPAALPGILTGILVALARIAGETAPLLFTSFNNRYFTTRLDQPIASLTVQVYTYAISPYDDWHRQAWAGALVLVAFVFVFSVLARVVTRRLERMHRA